jgi:DNA-binding MarR family transcriptional regulator
MSDDPVERVERAMVAIRRGQTRRALGRLHSQRSGADVDVDPTLMGVLDAVEELGGGCGVGDIAAALGIDQPRASRLVARAVERDLLVRNADQRDGRRTPVTLTATAQRLLARAHRFRREVFAEAMDGWSDADRAAFARLLGDFVASYARITGQQR